MRRWIGWATILMACGLAVFQLCRTAESHLRPSVSEFKGTLASGSLGVERKRLASKQNDSREQSGASSSGMFFEALSVQRESPQEAISLLKKALQENPQFESAHERLSEVYLELNAFEAARNASAICLNVNSRNIACHHSLVKSIVADEGISAARGAIDDCLRVVPDDLVCLKNLREYYLALGDSDGFDRFLASQFRSKSKNLGSEPLSQAMFYSAVGESAKANARLVSACDRGDLYACKVLEEIRNRKH